MSATTAIDTSLVWLINSEEPAPPTESRNLIRANAAAWGHKHRRRANRNQTRSKVPLAPELHFNVCGYGFWHAKSQLIPSDHATFLQQYRVERTSSWSGGVLRSATSSSVFQREKTAIFCNTHTQIADHAGR